MVAVCVLRKGLAGTADVAPAERPRRLSHLCDPDGARNPTHACAATACVDGARRAGQRGGLGLEAESSPGATLLLDA